MISSIFKSKLSSSTQEDAGEIEKSKMTTFRTLHLETLRKRLDAYLSDISHPPVFFEHPSKTKDSYFRLMRRGMFIAETAASVRHILYLAFAD